MRKSVRFLPGLLFAAVAACQTPTFSVVYTFPFTASTSNRGTGYWPQGDGPQGPLLQASDGNFYGTTMSGGFDGQCTGDPGTHPCAGTIFKLTPQGQLTVLHTFAWENITAPYVDGSTPAGGLAEGPDGYLYGSATRGGLGTTPSSNTSSGNGLIFRISKTGQFQILHSFADCTLNSCPEGRFPTALVLGRDGKFYGTTQGVATNTNAATIFRISASGVLEILHTFSGIPDGTGPLGLIQGSDCNFYGDNGGGGPTANSSGTVFRITPGGAYTVLYSFSSAAGAPVLNGHTPLSRVVQASNGKLYGSTNRGGVYGLGAVYEVGLDGTFRKILDLNKPASMGGLLPLFQASDGNLWGVSPETYLFTINIASGSVQTVPFPCAQSGTGTVNGPLIQGMDGKLYGGGSQTPCATGTSNTGVIFSIDAGLPKPPNPVVNAVTNGASFAAGMLVPGEIATAFGTNLTGSTGINLTSSLPLPNSFLNSTVLVNGCAATPLFAVDNVNGQQQINFQAPWEIAGQQAVAVQVVNNGGISPAVDIPVLAAQPGIIAILHADYSPATTASPVTAGETVLIYGTGLGAVSTAQVDGTAANGESTIALPTVTIGGASSMVTFSGLAPGFVGLNQVNVMVPSGLASGNQAVVMSAGDVTSNSVLLPVR